MIHETRRQADSFVTRPAHYGVMAAFAIGLAALSILLGVLRVDAQPGMDVPSPFASQSCADVTAVPPVECAALVDLYQATDGDGWLNRMHWQDFTPPNTPCTWFGVTCNGGRVTELVLPANALSGTLPITLDALTGLTRLRLENNALTGRIPKSICALTSTLTDASFAYNALFARTRSAERCADAIDPDWGATQTTKVTDLRPVEFFTNALRIAWTPISYTADGGHYEIMAAINATGPYTVLGQTADKSASSYLIEGLAPAGSYFVAVRSVTPAHDDQNNTLTSDPAVTAGVTKAVNGERVLVAAYFPADNDLAAEISYVVERFRFGTALNPNVQVVMLVDGRQDGDTRVIEMAGGEITATDAVLQQWSVTELDTADPAVLTWFLQYARTRYPSQREVVALMGHGIAPIPEFAFAPATETAGAVQASAKFPPLPKEHEFTPSDLTDNSYMSTVALGRALLDATNQGADPFDVIFFDQCFQGSLDTLYEVRKSATVFVASPNYAWLVAAYDKYIARFSPTAAPAALADDIIGAYQGSLDADHPNAIFWVRSSDIEAIAGAVNNLGDALRSALQASEAPRIVAAVQQSKYVDTTQCSRQNLQLGPPDELIGLDTFGEQLKENFGAGDPAGVSAAVDALQIAMSRVNKLARAGAPYLAPDEFWDYRDTLTVLAPLPRNSPSAVAWRASLYRSDTPFAARWAIDPSQTVTVTQSLAFASEGRWAEFLADWYDPLTPTVGAWCNYSPPERTALPDAELITLTAQVSGTEAIALTWAPVDDVTATEVRLYAVKPNAIGLTVAATFPVSQTAVTLTGLAPGGYQFALLARDGAFAGVARSGIVTVTLEADTPQIFLPLVVR
ncbi:MAG: clostripain-related cysteine peptidase [Caldilinea sp.]